MAEENLGPSPLSPIDLNDRALILSPGASLQTLTFFRLWFNQPIGSNLVWSAPLPNPNQANSALTYYLHFGSIIDQKLRVVSALLTHILSEPAFNILRTREQLGYMVTCTLWLLPGASERGLRIAVQSEKKPGYLEERAEAFLREMKTKLEEMTDEEFGSQKTGLGKKWLEADKNLDDEASRLFKYITSGHLDFLRGRCSISRLTFRHLIFCIRTKGRIFIADHHQRRCLVVILDSCSPSFQDENQTFNPYGFSEDTPQES